MNPDPIQNESAEAGPAQAPTTAGMTTKVVKGSLWTLAGQVAPLGVSLFTTPFVIRLLGSEGYGVLILVGLIPTYFAFADLGMGIASTKFASEAYAAGDAKREANTVHTAAAMSFILSVPVAALIFIFSNAAVGLFNVPEHLRGEANIALKIASVTFVINFLNSIFNTPQLTRLRMDLNTFVSSGFRMLGLIATPITIYLGGGIVGAIAILLCVSLLTLAANIAVSGKLLKELFAFSLDRNAIRPMLKFGSALAVAAITMSLLNNVEKAILPSVLSIKYLAYYSVAFTLAGMVFMFSSSMLQSLVPAFSQLQHESKRAQLTALYNRGFKFTLIWLLPALVMLVIFGKLFIRVWAGQDFSEESTVPFYILLLGLVFNIPAYLPYALIMASGRTSLFTKLYLAELVPYLFLVMTLTYEWGIIGAASAWSIRMAIDSLLLFVFSRRLIDKQILIKTTWGITSIALVLLPTIATSWYFDGINFFVLTVLLVSSCLYCYLIYKVMLSIDEKSWIVASVRHKLRFN